MTIEEIKTLLETTRLPVAHLSFPENEAPNLPFICFINPDDNNFAADGIVYFSSKNIQVELYIPFRNTEIEEKVEKAISSFFYTKDSEYLGEEKCWMIIYKLEV